MLIAMYLILTMFIGPQIALYFREIAPFLGTLIIIVLGMSLLLGSVGINLFSDNAGGNVISAIITGLFRVLAEFVRGMFHIIPRIFRSIYQPLVAIGVVPILAGILAILIIV